MDTLIAAIAAIFGTLAGSIVNHVLQGRSAFRAENFARSERVRQDRVQSYAEFGKAIMDYRRAEFARWEQRRDSVSSDAAWEARSEAHRNRGIAWHVLFQVQLLDDDPELIDSATRLLDITSDLHHAENSEDLVRRGSLVREELTHFMGIAANHLRQPTSPGR
ncbi:hypothetical protein [Streptomyces sp. NPDC056660]|uniref:hypothetical protein n=1 Tax=Streptomyces sp. NPDC056660 TaxID=3345897 RepID=UPI0036BA4306